MKRGCTLEKAVIEALEGRTLLSADLRIQGVVPSQILDAGGAIHARIVMRNTGNAPAGPFSTAVVLSTDNVFGNADDIPLAMLPEPGLASRSRISTGQLALAVPGNIPV